MPTDQRASANRRNFIKTLGVNAGLTAFNPQPASAQLPATGAGTLSPQQRQQRAYQLRHEAALFHRQRSPDFGATNGDEGMAGFAASFSKTLPHNNLGEVDPQAYTAYLRAIHSGKPSDFEAIPMGGAGKLANPQASYAFSTEGPDGHQISLAAPPSMASAAAASEMVENYWLALTRDVPFAQYDSSPLIQQAADDLSRLSAITPQSIFRGKWSGDFTGPYISQFLMLPVPYGPGTIEQRYKTAAPGVDFMTSYPEWLAVQKGTPPSQKLAFDEAPRYIRNGRDLASYLHTDFSYQAVLNAALILAGFGGSVVNDANPYKTSKNQGAFATFGVPEVLDMVARVSCAALKATWNQKWLLHRRLRPEAFAGRVHNHVTKAAQYPLHGDVLNSAALPMVFSRHGSYLLPQAFPEGSPTHPSYPAGHAALVGAGVTVLKAFFKGSALMPNPMTVGADGLALAPYGGAALTVAGELNKLASNISLGRDTAGVHYRSDGVEGMRLGEAVALGVLHDMLGCYTEDFSGFTITRFDGAEVSLCRDCVL